MHPIDGIAPAYVVRHVRQRTGFIGDFGALTQDQTLLKGNWLLRQSCSDTGCRTYSKKESPFVLFVTATNMSRHEDDMIFRSQTFRIVENAFPDDDHGLTAGLELYEDRPHHFGVSDRALYLSIGDVNRITEWYGRCSIECRRGFR